MPHSLEAEQSVIGSMFIDAEAIAAATEQISGEDFYNRQYGVVFDTIVELNNEGKPIDFVTLQDRLRSKEDVPPEVSGLDFLTNLIAAVPTSANIKYYAGIVAEKATLRRLIRTNEEIANTCYSGKESLDTILESTESKINEVVQKKNVKEFVPIRTVVMNAMDKIEKASKLHGTVTGIATGFIDLDYRTAGMQPSDGGGSQIHSAFRHKSTCLQNLTNMNLVIVIVGSLDVRRYPPQQKLRIVFDEGHRFGIGKVFAGGKNDLRCSLRWWKFCIVL